MAIRAKFSGGRCPECGQQIEKGQLIDRPYNTKERWAHVQCSDDPVNNFASLRPGETVCDVCWLIHPKGACDRAP